MFKEAESKDKTVYDIAVVLELVDNALTLIELKRVCLESFNEFYKEYGELQEKSDFTMKLVDYAKRRGQLGDLLRAVRKLNDYQFDLYKNRLIKGSNGNMERPWKEKPQQKEPPPISSLEVEQTQEDIKCLSKDVRRYKETEQIRKQLQKFIDFNEMYLEEASKMTRGSWKGPQTPISNIHRFEFDSILSKLDQYLEDLHLLMTVAQENFRRDITNPEPAAAAREICDWQKIGTGILELKRAREEAKPLKIQFDRDIDNIFDDFRISGWSDEWPQQIRKGLINLEKPIKNMQEEIPVIQENLYLGIKEIVERLAIRFKIEDVRQR
jgi:hypothetical protein